MEWEFSAQQVVRGECAYGLVDFRHDLAAELDINLPGSASERARNFRLAYDLCYWLATERSFADFAEALAGEPGALRLAHALREPMRPNVDMLAAILQRMINEGIARGLDLESAVDAAAREHARIVGWPPMPRQPA